MKTLNLKFVAVAVVLISITSFSYYSFASFRPKSLRELEEVKGASDSTEFEFIYPSGSKEVGINKLSEGYVVSIESEKSPADIQRFYKNVFEIKGWDYKGSSDDGGFLVTTFESGNQVVTISAFADDKSEKTLVTLEVSKD
jgi:hypothetical protein